MSLRNVTQIIYKTHCKQQVEDQVGEHLGVRRSPVAHDGCLLDGQLVLGPGKVRKQLVHLLVRAQLAGNKLTEAVGE